MVPITETTSFTEEKEFIHEATVCREQTKAGLKSTSPARCWWLTPVILAIWEAEIRRIVV
jgi:hypothetical protein